MANTFAKTERNKRVQNQVGTGGNTNAVFTQIGAAAPNAAQNSFTKLPYYPNVGSEVTNYGAASGSTTNKNAGNSGTTQITSGNTTTNKNAGNSGTTRITSGNTTKNANNTLEKVTADQGFNYGDYQQSNLVTQAQALLQQQIASKPGAYQSQWQGQINDAMNQYMNRDPFSYDFNSDALYEQYKDNYIQQGQMAMMDTMGQAAAMTGGYGNSYAQTVGQQAYNQQLSQLNNIMPELYQAAYDRYSQEGQNLLNQYNMLMDQESLDYGRYQDSLSNWYTQLDYLTGNYNTEREFDYGQWADDRNLAYDEYQSNLDREYRKERDEKEDAMWQSQFDTQNQQWQDAFDREGQQWQDAFDREGQQTNYNRLADLILTTGYAPSESELTAAGMSESEANALKDAYTASITPVSGGSGGSGGGYSSGSTAYDSIDLDHVSSSSDADIISNLLTYQKKGDNTSMANYLDMLVESGRLTQNMADNLYVSYMVITEDEQVNTDVDLNQPPKDNSLISNGPMLHPDTKNYGYGGRYPTKVTLYSM